MEIVNHAKEKTITLPVGVRFDPTDDILVYYLRKKVLAQPLPNTLIQDYDVFQTEPWKLPGGEKHLNWQKFFFYNTEARVFENPDKRTAGNGQWRAVEKDQDLIGKRNTLVFWEAKGKRFTETKWVMHEFRLAPISNPSQMTIWAVYRIFEMEKKIGKKSKGSRGETSNSNNVGRA
ncbi:NAC domain-containing protein 83 [Spatholobus suberectus]|nr:NAC domain-containing protein 83 [Spatholobus suberectus]